MTKEPPDQTFDELVADLATDRTCEVRRQEWPKADEFGNLSSWVPGLPHDRPCTNTATRWIEWRACPCRSKSRAITAIKPIDTLKTLGGLIVIGQLMCEGHRTYYNDALPFPFICPQCGVIYANAGDMVIRDVPISEA